MDTGRTEAEVGKPGGNLSTVPPATEGDVDCAGGSSIAGQASKEAPSIIPFTAGMELSLGDCSWMAVVSDVTGGVSVGITDLATASGSTEGWK